MISAIDITYKPQSEPFNDPAVKAMKL